MSNRPGSKQRWSKRGLALYGGLLGLLVGVVHSFVHAFWSPPFEDDLVTHILGQMALFIGGGAVGLAAVAAILNWLRRKP